MVKQNSGPKVANGILCLLEVSNSIYNRSMEWNENSGI